MNQPVSFADVLDAVDQLDPESQAELVDVIRRRLAGRSCEQIAATVDQARREFAAGKSHSKTAAEIVREAR